MHGGSRFHFCLDGHWQYTGAISSTVLVGGIELCGLQPNLQRR